MSIDEHETTIAFNYAEKVVRIYTTRSGAVNQILKRSNNQAIVQDNGDLGASIFQWNFAAIPRCL
ncbi:hypothetical protein H6F51_24655 [Cyanobacteria bacterium FACHB-DQ100]|nr:hypothetical protein [Cyanobacteria bacterium FACHB-DQ100]